MGWILENFKCQIKKIGLYFSTLTCCFIWGKKGIMKWVWDVFREYIRLNEEVGEKEYFWNSNKILLGSLRMNWLMSSQRYED